RRLVDEDMPLAQRLRKPSQAFHVVDQAGYAGTAGAIVQRLHCCGVERSRRLDPGIGLKGSELAGQRLVEDRLLTRQGFGVAITEHGQLAAQQSYTPIVLTDRDRFARTLERQLLLALESLQTGERLLEESIGRVARLQGLQIAGRI